MKTVALQHVYEYIRLLIYDHLKRDLESIVVILAYCHVSFESRAKTGHNRNNVNETLRQKTFTLIGLGILF